MNAELEQKIQRIKDSRDDTPIIFKVILNKEMGLTEAEEILDVIYIRRVYSDNVKRTDLFSKAIMLVLTNYGVVIVEEGLEDYQLEAGGYRIRHIMYSQIKFIDFDTCLLVGRLKLMTGSTGDSDVQIAFNTSRYFNDIANAVTTIRAKMIEHQFKDLN